MANTKGVTMTDNNSYCRLYGPKWGAITVTVLRLLIGAVFIFSGFTKGIDPWGSIYKFDEYLHSFGFYDYDGLLTFMAFSVSMFEFALGVFMVTGCYRRFTPIAMTVMMAVMLPLTLYIAITNNVADCGCFGDAVTLSNWATFWKNVFLTLAIVYMVKFNNRVPNYYGLAVQWIVALLTIVYIWLIAWEGYFVQPFIDFRPYPVGTIISTQDDEYGNDEEFLFVYEKDGVTQEFTLDSLPDETWTFVDRKAIDNTDSKDTESQTNYNPITVYDEEYEDASYVILGQGKQLLLLFPSLSDVVIPFSYLINEMHDFCELHDIDVVGLTSDDIPEIEEWTDLSMAAYPMYVIDDTELKMIARGNPAAVLLRDGEIAWKQTLRSIPLERLSAANSFDDLIGDFMPHHLLYFLTFIYLTLMLVVLIINRTHLLVKFSLRRARKNQKKQVNLQPEQNVEKEEK